MRRVAIFLRKTASVNKFRSAILGALRTDLVDNALLCSGFFQDDAKYSAATDFDLISHRKCNSLKVTTLGLYSYSWKAQYATFLTQLQAQNKCPCFSAVQMRIPSMGWHAKVFLAKQGNVPLEYRQFKRPFRTVWRVGGDRASASLGGDRTFASGISASRGRGA